MASNENITLDDIARAPGRVNSLSADATRQLSAQLEMARGALKARRIILFGEPALSGKLVSAEPVREREDQLLHVAEAARRLGIAKDTLYRNADEYPFTRRVRPRCLRFSEQGIADYMRAKKAGSSDASEDGTSMWRNRRYE
jgi:predicted DNA-binding transcriptional regulator AlpA